MKLKNVLIVVKDIEKAKRFYQELFGLTMILDNDGNMILKGLSFRMRKSGENSSEERLFLRIMPASYILKNAISRRLRSGWRNCTRTPNMSTG